jgi:hypothetical protein
MNESKHPPVETDATLSFYEEMFRLIHLVDPHFVRRVRGHVYVLGISMLPLFLLGDVWTHSSS